MLHSCVRHNRVSTRAFRTLYASFGSQAAPTGPTQKVGHGSSRTTSDYSRFNGGDGEMCAMDSKLATLRSVLDPDPLVGGWYRFQKWARRNPPLRTGQIVSWQDSLEAREPGPVTSFKEKVNSLWHGFFGFSGKDVTWRDVVHYDEDVHSTSSVGQGADKEVYCMTGPKRVSFWHDVKVATRGTRHLGDDVIWMVNEIPVGTRDKLEINLEKPYNPITQDRNDDGSPREFTYGDIPFNYGCVPCTWEDPDVVDRHVYGSQYKGDGDPIDVVDIGETSLGVGEVTPFRVLGALGLIDQGEMDWKIIGVNIHSELATQVACVNDIPAEKLDSIRDWFVNYKTTDGKAKNELAFNGELLDKGKAMMIVRDGHAAWRELVATNGGKHTYSMLKDEFFDMNARMYWVQ